MTNTYKVSRTLSLKKYENMNYDEQFKNLSGLTSFVLSKNNTYYLNFDNRDNCEKSFTSLKEGNYKPRYVYYKLFFRMNGLEDTSDYNDVKTRLVKQVEELTKSTVLYFKLYIKDKKYLGYGDLSLDNMDGSLQLLKSKTFTLDEKLSGTFYKYNKKRVENKTN
jgi:hypothetical protein